MKRVALPIVVAALLLADATPAWAEASNSNANTQVGPFVSGPAVTKGTAGFDSTGTQASAGSRTTVPDTGSAPPPTAAGSGTTLVPIPGNVIVATAAPTINQFGVVVTAPGLPANACPPGQTGFFVQDANGATTGILCTGGPASARGAPAPTPLALAQQASAEQPWPVLTMAANPGVGLTGLASWFWMGGSAAMPDATASAGGLRVTVRAVLSQVVWMFGDGSALAAGPDLGRPFPAPSTIQHLYQTDTFGRADYVVTALLRYTVSFSVNGGPFAFLGVKARPYSGTYLVNQLQPQAVSAT